MQILDRLLVDPNELSVCMTNPVAFCGVNKCELHARLMLNGRPLDRQRDFPFARWNDGYRTCGLAQSAKIERFHRVRRSPPGSGGYEADYGIVGWSTRSVIQSDPCSDRWAAFVQALASTASFRKQCARN